MNDYAQIPHIGHVEIKRNDGEVLFSGVPSAALLIVCEDVADKKYVSVTKFFDANCGGEEDWLRTAQRLNVINSAVSRWKEELAEDIESSERIKKACEKGGDTEWR